jgi:hypothetical protein
MKYILFLLDGFMIQEINLLHIIFLEEHQLAPYLTYPSEVHTNKLMLLQLIQIV